MMTPIPGARTLSHEPTLQMTNAEAVEIALAASGDTHAFERLYRAHVRRVHNLVRRMLGEDDVDELTQDIFVRVWQKLGTFRGDSAFSTWLHRLAVNVVLARRSELGTRRQRYFDDDAPLAMVSARRTTPEAGLDFENALLQLPDGARQVFVLHDMEGYRHEEIADMLGVAAGTSKSQLHRARMALRRHLDR